MLATEHQPIFQAASPHQRAESLHLGAHLLKPLRTARVEPLDSKAAGEPQRRKLLGPIYLTETAFAYLCAGRPM
eukprot:5886550-Pleurochrysis_carterae.AAC.6